MVSKLRYAALVLLAGLFTYMLSAQAAPAGPRMMTLKTVQVDVSQPPSPNSHAQAQLPLHFANPALLGEVKAALASGKPYPYKSGGASHGKPTPTSSPSSTPTSTPTSTASPVPISSGVTNPVPITTTFDAMYTLDGGGYEPPDTTLGAGPGYVVEAVNVMGEVYDTSGNPVTNINTAACTTNPSTDAVSDPRVLYDSVDGRWFISTMTFSPIGDASWNLLISTGSDPTAASWECLIIPTNGIRNPDGSTGNFPDFPKMGISSDKVILTGDAFSLVGGRHSQSYKFQGTEFVVINKSDLLGTAGVTTELFGPPQGDFAIEPAQELGTTLPSNLYMAAVNSSVSSTSNMDVWTVSGVPGGNSVSVSKQSLPIDTIYYPPNAVQAGTSTLIDTNDDSLLDAVYRDSTGSLWVSANDGCTPPGDNAVRSCLRFINVSIPASGPMSIAQDFDYADPGMYYYYPAVRTDSSGNLFAAFTGSSSSMYASAYAGLQVSSSNNVLTNLSMTRGGEVPYTISPPRWGDYSGAAVDPNGSVWLGAEYALNSPLGILGPFWGTEITNVTP